MIAYDANHFREQFGDALPSSTGSLRRDVESYGRIASAAYWDIANQAPHPWVWCNGLEIMAALNELVVNLTALYVQLAEQGFAPPAVSYKDDPLGFIMQGAEFLTRIAPLVVDPAHTVH